MCNHSRFRHQEPPILWKKVPPVPQPLLRLLGGRQARRQEHPLPLRGFPGCGELFTEEQCAEQGAEMLRTETKFERHSHIHVRRANKNQAPPEPSTRLVYCFYPMMQATTACVTTTHPQNTHQEQNSRSPPTTRGRSKPPSRT